MNLLYILRESRERERERERERGWMARILESKRETVLFKPSHIYIYIKESNFSLLGQLL
jgi:hypothetical protein